MTDSDDLTRLTAHELGARLRAGDVDGPGDHGRPPRAGAGDRSRPPRLADDRRRARARRGRRRRCPARGRARRGPGRRRRPPPAARDPGRAQGPRLDRGRPGDRGVADPRGLRLALRRPHHRAAARRRCRDPRQDQHGRVRDGLVHRALRVRADGEPVGPRPRPRRLERRAPRRRSPPATSRSGIGTDTGGSIRQPAALCGVVGMKPTYGRVSRYGIVAFASSLDQIGPFARDTRDAAALLHAIAGRDERDSTSAPIPVPDDLVRLPASDDEAASWLRGRRLGLPREYFVAGMEPGVEARVREAVAGARGRGRDRRGGQPAAHRLRARDVLHRRPGGGLGQPRPLRRRPVRLQRPRRRRLPRELPRDPRPGLRRRGQAAGHAGHVRAVGRLLRRVLRQGAEGPHAHQARLRPAVGGGLRRPRGPDVALGGVPRSAPGWPTRCRCTCPMRARCR